MHDPDFEQFSAMLDDVAALLKPSEPLTGTARAMFFRALASLSLQQVRAALDAHVRDPQRGRFFPRPADVLAQIDDGRPGADEAWAIAVKGNDEDATIVWTDEMAQAWGIARPVMQLGDEVGARVAFRDAYGRLTAEARAQGRAAQWMPSLGLDAEQRHAALHDATVMGRLASSQVAGYLPAPAASAMPDNVRQHLTALRARLTRTDPVSVEPSEDATAKVETLAAQHATERRVRDYANRNGLSLAQSQIIHSRESA